jgi:hypothetical protein
MRHTTFVFTVSTALLAYVFGSVAWAQTVSGPNPQGANLDEMLRQLAAQDVGRLHEYQWIETTTTTVQGHTRPAQKSICRFGPDGALIRTPLDPQTNSSPQLKGGPLMRSMEKKKIEEIQEQMAQVHKVAALYLPLNPAKLSQAMQTDHVAFEHDPTSGDAVSLSDYAKPGDRLTFNLNSTTRQIQSVSVKTFLSTSDDPFDITLQFSKLEDGTTYPSITTIEVPSKKISITTMSSEFSKPVQ